MSLLSKQILTTHLIGGCSIASKQGHIPVIGPRDTDCGCVSALVLAARTSTDISVTAAAKHQFAAKGLIFNNRYSDAIYFARKAVVLYGMSAPDDRLASLSAKGDVALALACSDRSHRPRAIEMWASIVFELKAMAFSSRAARILLQHVHCEKYYAVAVTTDLRSLRTISLQKAFSFGHPSQHPFLMRIIVELELLGDTTHGGLGA